MKRASLKMVFTMSALLLAGCSTTARPMYPSPVAPIANLAPINGVVGTAAWLQNFCEDPDQDARTITNLEATADLISLPATMATYTARLAAYSTVGLVMVLSGSDPKETVDLINDWLPWALSAPDPDRIQAQDVAWSAGCT